MTTTEAIAATVATLAANFNRAVTPELLMAYKLGLRGLTVAEIEASAARALERCKFMPNVAELIELAGKLRSVKAEALQVWNAVRKAIDVYDYTVWSIDFGSTVNAVIYNLGGWDVLCRAKLTELDNPGWIRKRFTELYESLASAPPESLRGALLSGSSEGRAVSRAEIVVAIPGLPAPARQLPQKSEIATAVRQLADSKS